MHEAEKLIQQKLEWHRTEMARLETALQVLQEIDARRDAAPAKRGKGTAGKRGRTNGRTPKPSAVRERILAALAGEGMKSGAVIEHLEMKDSKQSVYSALNQLKAQGKVEKNAGGVYSVVKQS